MNTAPSLTCAGCATRWRGASRRHCSRCHLTFSGVTAFDLHQRGGVCLDPGQLDLVLGVGGIWSLPSPRDGGLWDG